ncbi:MAG TPA: tetratricopeptide repeat protein, partial [Spirillospora sp.]|nr:tetratricopeptide repeat protein [Spirillospora sp.]
ETALNALQAMGISPQQLLGQQAHPSAPAYPDQSQQPETRAAQSQMRPGTPMPDPQRLASAQQQVDEIVRQYQRTPDRIEGIEWVRKTRRRAGERDSLYLRIYVWSGALGILAAILIIGGLIVWNTPSLRGIVFAPTWTPTFTPTLTPTNTPGFTPTPSPTPELTLTPSPTIDPDIVQGQIDAPPLPTRIYPELTNRRLSDALALINRGEHAAALPTLVREREATELSFDAAPYYYEALALLGVGETDIALDRLQEAERRLGEAREPGFKPLIDTGFAQVHLQMAQEAFAARNNSLAFDMLDATELRAKSAIDSDPLIVPAYIALARRYQYENQYGNALSVINDALSNPALKADVNLIVERGEIYFQQGELDKAAQEAYTALYIDPTVEEAYLLQIKTALEQGNPGLAVIYAQNYLFFYPGSAEGYKLLGDARMAEGNTDLALIAYNQALAAETVTPATVPALLARARIYMDQRRYDLAQADYGEAYDLTNDPEIRAQRMRAVFLAGNLALARADAESLRGTDIVPDSELDLLLARILIARSNENSTEELTEALRLLQNAPSGSQAVASEYRARAQFLLGQYNDALSSIDTALNSTETGSRHYLRGQILEALDRPEDAIREYEWVVAWSEIYPYPFLPDARRRLRTLQDA